MAQSIHSPTVLHADQEHARLRGAVILLLIFSMIALFFAFNWLWSVLIPNAPDISFFVSCLAAVAGALVLVWAAERGLKQVWHSGRSITLGDKGIIVANGSHESYEMSWLGHMSFLFWRFNLQGYKRGGRERRVPNGWICLAVQVKEEDHRLVAFTYVPPKQLESLVAAGDRDPFHEISPEEVYQSVGQSRYMTAPSRPDKIPPEILAGAEGQYWYAEKQRWDHGYELTPEDFERLLALIQAHV